MCGKYKNRGANGSAADTDSIMPKETKKSSTSGGGSRGRGRGRGRVPRQMIRNIAVSASCLLHTNPF